MTKKILTGHAEIEIEENQFKVSATDGLVTVMVGYNQGSALWLYHPLSGWYLEMDRRDGGPGSIETVG